MKLRLFLTLLLPLLAGFTPTGDTPEARGQSIVDEAERRGEGFGDMTASLTMTIRNARGAEAVREMDIQVLEKPEGSRSLAVVQQPKDVRGTALLTHSYDHEDDQQWLYFPAVKRVKRIAAQARSGPFMGSEFTYEDMTGQASEKYNYKLLGEEKIAIEGGEIDCWKIERIPKPEAQSSYKRHVSWVEKEFLWLVKVEFYDQNDDHLKTLEAADFELFEDKYWRAHELVMTNVRTG
ncbi:MAG: outer membrane lipoprotein-sorting protein, partial [Nevskiales bacterium]